MDKLDLGVQPNVSFQYSKQSDGNEYYFHSIGLGIFGKYYSNNGFVAVIECGASYDEDENTIYSIFPRFGFAYFINQKVSLEVFIGPRFAFGKSEYFEIPLSIGFLVFL